MQDAMICLKIEKGSFLDGFFGGTGYLLTPCRHVAKIIERFELNKEGSGNGRFGLFNHVLFRSILLYSRLLGLVRGEHNDEPL